MDKINVRPSEFAVHLGISLTSAEGYYYGRHRIRKVVCLAMEAVWGIRAEYILDGTRPEYLRQRTLDLPAPALTIAQMAQGLPVKLRRHYKLALRAWHCEAAKPEK